MRKMKKAVIKLIFKMVLILILSTVVGAFFLSIVYLLPTDRIQENVHASVEQLVKEGDHFTIFSDLQYTDFDNYSDANYLNGALVDNAAEGVFSCLYGYEYVNANAQIAEDKPVAVLASVFQEDKKLQYKEYGRRFWNGYEVVLKPMLFFLNYGQIRKINLYLGFVLLLVLVLLLHKYDLSKYSVALVISYLLLNPVTMAASMAFSGFLFCTYIPCILMLVFNKKLNKSKSYPIFFMLVGICVAYFNMNYLQLLSFAYVLTFYCILNDLSKNMKDVLVTFVSLFVCWSAGFFGMYFMKWLLCELVTDMYFISDMIERSLYRISATAYYTGPSISRIGALFKNVKFFVVNTFWLLIELGYIVFVYFTGRKNKKYSSLSVVLHENASMLLMFFLVFVLVILRFLIFANHVYVHAWVMYRLFDAAVLFFNVTIMNIFVRGTNE